MIGREAYAGTPSAASKVQARPRARQGPARRRPTARNWNTVTKLLDSARGLAAREHDRVYRRVASTAASEPAVWSTASSGAKPSRWTLCHGCGAENSANAVQRARSARATGATPPTRAAARSRGRRRRRRSRGAGCRRAARPAMAACAGGSVEERARRERRPGARERRRDRQRGEQGPHERRTPRPPGGQAVPLGGAPPKPESVMGPPSP